MKHTKIPTWRNVYNNDKIYIKLFGYSETIEIDKTIWLMKIIMNEDHNEWRSYKETQLLSKGFHILQTKILLQA